MLTMTEDAATLVQTLTDRGALAKGGGVRIVINGETNSLSMSLAAGAEDTDAVVERGHALVFLSAPAAQRIQNATLCAEIDPRRSSFFLRQVQSARGSVG